MKDKSLSYFSNYILNSDYCLIALILPSIVSEAFDKVESLSIFLPLQRTSNKTVLLSTSFQLIADDMIAYLLVTNELSACIERYFTYPIDVNGSPVSNLYLCRPEFAPSINKFTSNTLFPTVTCELIVEYVPNESDVISTVEATICRPSLEITESPLMLMKS